LKRYHEVAKGTKTHEGFSLRCTADGREILKASIVKIV
jgi:hypothetical protein